MIALLNKAVYGLSLLDFQQRNGVLYSQDNEDNLVDEDDLQDDDDLLRDEDLLREDDQGLRDDELVRGNYHLQIFFLDD